MTRQTRGGRRARRAGATALVLLGLSLANGPADADPEEPGETASCPVVATAQAMSTTVQKDGDLTLSRPVGGQVPAAQACLNAALSDSTAYASAAFPGDTVVSAPGTAADFPAYVASSYPSAPEAKADTAGYVVQAMSSETVSRATAQTGPPSTGTAAGRASAEAKGSVDVAAGTATAKAASLSAPMTIADVLSLGEVHSTAEASVNANGAVARRSSLEVARSTVAGQVVTIDANGVHAAGQVVPLPGTQSVTDALSAAGITITYVAPQNTKGGVLSAGVSVSVVARDAAGVRTVTTYVLGRSFASVAKPLAGPGQASPSPLPSEAGSSVPPTEAGGGQDGPGFAGGPALGPAQSPADAGGTTPSVAQGPRLEPRASQVLLRGPVATLSPFYLVLVAGGLVLLVSGTSVRIFGVKTRWIS